VPRKPALHAVALLLVALATGARAAAAEDENPAGASPGSSEPAGPAAAGEPPAPPAAGDPIGVDYYPPPVDGPALRLPEPRTRVYLDGAYAVSNDLSALPYIAGKGRNVRIALGGAWRWRRFAFDAQLPFNITTVDITSLLNQAPMPQDAHQTAPSLGDLALGAVWSERLAGDSEALIAGVGLRGRLPTHTTRFSVHLADYSLAIFTIPYYFHVEPTLILGGALGPLTYVVNQGAIGLFGPDGNIQGEPIVVPSIYLWDAHYALGVAPWSFLGASVELATTFVLNHLDDPNFKAVNGLRAVWVAPALQIHAGDSWRIDLIARLGLTRGQELYGVLEYVGTDSFTLRVTCAF
jgi:hypothetical protein